MAESMIKNLTKDCLQYKGVVTTNNMDYLVETGIHYNETSLQYNIPSFGTGYSIGYSHVIVINTGAITQIVINAGLNIAYRKRSGSPASWSSWKYVNENNKVTSTVTTNANGFVDLSGIINSQTQVPLQAYVYSADYPNGLIGTLLCTGSSQSGRYWIKVTDSGAGGAIKSTSVEMTVCYTVK